MNNKLVWAEATALGCMLLVLFILWMVLLFDGVILNDHPLILFIEIVIISVGLFLYISIRNLRFTFHPKKNKKVVDDLFEVIKKR